MQLTHYSIYIYAVTEKVFMHYDMAVCYGMFRGWVNSSTNTKPSSYMYMHIGLLVLGCNVLVFCVVLRVKGPSFTASLNLCIDKLSGGLSNEG